MIVVKIMGGLGNQMFQYAVGRSLATRHRTSLYLDISGYQQMAPEDTPRHYELDLYHIRAKLANENILKKVQTAESVIGKRDKILRRIGRGNIWTVLEAGSGYNDVFSVLPNNTYLLGWWQTPKYFDSIRHDLLKDFEPNQPISKKNESYLQDILDSESISIHVRRGDYISNSFAAAHHGSTTIKYYEKAIKHIQSNVSKPKFFVFSDDLAWCRKNLDLPKDSIYVSGNEGDDAYEDIRLMKNCRHNIIANSSFSWWGAWLNINTEKIVVAPKVWFENKTANKEVEIIPKDWLRL